MKFHKLKLQEQKGPLCPGLHCMLNQVFFLFELFGTGLICIESMHATLYNQLQKLTCVLETLYHI